MFNRADWWVCTWFYFWQVYRVFLRSNKMTQGFDEFYDELELQCLNTQEVGELCFEAGAASRQAEINALSALGEMSEQKIDDLVLRNIELQKRIDEALDYVFRLYCTGDLDTERLENILKGDSSDRA